MNTYEQDMKEAAELSKVRDAYAKLQHTLEDLDEKKYLNEIADAATRANHYQHLINQIHRKY